MVVCYMCFFFKQKTAYEMRISDWSSDVCSSDLLAAARPLQAERIERRCLQRKTLAAAEDRRPKIQFYPCREVFAFGVQHTDEQLRILIQFGIGPTEVVVHHRRQRVVLVRTLDLDVEYMCFSGPFHSGQANKSDRSRVRKGESD